jgi:LacI family transcriptional regulator
MPTISDVAFRAHVSPGTVSRVINAAENVSPEIRARVEQAIAELNYVPSMAARSLRSKRTSSLALVVPSVTNLFWRNLTRGVEDAAQGRGYAMLLCNHDDNLAKQQRYLEFATSQGVAGVVIAPHRPDPEELAILGRRAIPTVLVNRRMRGRDMNGVYSDSISAARALTRHLIELGHRRIALLSGPPELSTVQERITGYCVALREAGIPVDMHLIRSGEFRADSGERLTEQMLAAGLAPSAIVTANNEIALGAIAALARHGLRVPHDAALACFGDSDETYFPFLTCIVEPAYEMGTHAAQLLLNRLEQRVDAPVQEIVLPTRLVIRYSCGSRLKLDGPASPCLVVPPPIPVRSVLVRAFTAAEREAHATCIAGMLTPIAHRLPDTSHRDLPDADRLLDALAGRPTDRIPHLEFWFESRVLLEHILGRKLPADLIDTIGGGLRTTPEDDVELARLLGMDAVTCHFSWNLSAGSVRGWADLDHLPRPPSLADQLGRLARYLAAARNTGLGVIAGIRSPFGMALRAVGAATDINTPTDVDRSLVETLIDIVLEHQVRVFQAVCDRFSSDLAFVMVRDDPSPNGLLFPQTSPWGESYVTRLRQLIAPAKEHGKLVALHPGGRTEDLLPTLHEAGIDALHVGDLPLGHIAALRRRWSGKLAFIGGVPLKVLIDADRVQITEHVRAVYEALSPGSGYVLSVSAPVTDAVPPECFVALVQAAQRGRG